MKDYSDIKIEKNIPMPSPSEGTSRKAIIQKMEIGDSIAVKIIDRTKWCNGARLLKYKVVTRQIRDKDGYVRMWRTV